MHRHILGARIRGHMVEESNAALPELVSEVELVKDLEPTDGRKLRLLARIERREADVFARERDLRGRNRLRAK
jgi:hypothetical protein